MKKIFQNKYLKQDIFAGMSVAFILIPQSMAYTTLAGLPIQVGLYTACIPVIIAALFGSSKQMSTGPVTIISLMTATALAPIATAGSEWYVVYASLLALFIWIFYLALGIMRMWILVEFLSHPVILGFTNAIALITLTSQMGPLFGISIVKGGNYLVFLQNLFQWIYSETHLLTLLLWAGTIMSLIILKIVSSQLPRVLIAVVCSIWLSYLLWLWEYGVAIVGHIPEWIRGFSLPFLTPEFEALSTWYLYDLFIFALIIGLIGFTESISVAKLVSTQTKSKIRPNRELIWQWLANISSGVFGGYAVAGSFSKTAVNLRAGAQSPLASIITGWLVALVLIFFTPLLYHLPISVLAAIIIVSVADLIKIEPIITALKIEWHDGVIAISTFILTILMTPDIEMALFIWVGMSLILFIYRTMRPKIIEVARYRDGMFRDMNRFALRGSKKISVIRFDGHLYFANAGYFEEQITDLLANKEKLKFLIIDLSAMNNMDSAGYDVFDRIIDRLDHVWVHVYLCGMKLWFIEKFSSVWFIKKFWEHRIFSSIENALEYIGDTHKQDKETDKLVEFTPHKKKKPEIHKAVKKVVRKR
jgi:sulfate permease, SulP family